MRLLFWIASKNLASRRLHAVCAILGIAFGVATVIAVQVVDFNTVRGVREHHRRFTGDPEWVLTVKDPRRTDPASALDVLRREPGIQTLTPLLSDRVAISDGTRTVKGLPFFGLSFDAAGAFDAYGIAGGRDGSPGERGVFLAGPRLVEDGKLEIGRTYKLQRPSVTPYGCADGQLVAVEEGVTQPGPVVELELVGVLEDRHLGRANNKRSLLLSYEDGVALMGSAPFLPRYWVSLDPSASRAALQDRLLDDFRIEVPEAREVGETREERAFRSGVRLSSFTALGLGLFIIFHLLTLAVTSWVRQVGLLGALGITGATLAGVFIAEALLLATLGTGAGVGLGLAIARVLLAMDMTTLGWGRPVSGFLVPWDSVAWIAFAGVVACLLGALMPIARVRRVPIVEALTQGEAALGAATAPRWIVPLLLALLPPATLGLAWLLHPMDEEFLEPAFLVTIVFGAFVLALWGLPSVLGRVFGALIHPFERPNKVGAYLVRKGLKRGIRRFAGSVTGLSLVAAGLVTLHAITGALKTDKDDWASQALPGHVFVQLPGVLRGDLEPLREVEGVTSLVPVDAVFRQGVLELRGVPISELFAEGLLQGDGNDRARRLLEQGRGMVVTTVLARERDLALGDTVQLTTLKGRRSFEVVVIDDRFGYRPHEQAYALIDEATMHQVFCRDNARVNFLSVGVDDAGNERGVAARVRAFLDQEFGERVGNVWTGADQRSAYEAEINRDFALFDVILLLTAVLAGMGLLNALLVSALERTKETGLLRAIGVTRRQVSRLFLSEAVMLGLASGVLGTAIGVVLSVVAVRGLAALSGLPLSYEFEPLWALIAIGVLVLFSAMASLIPAARAGRADVISAIKYE